MMDDRFSPRPLARWYMVAAIAAVLFMLLGCASHFYKVAIMDPAQLRLDERAAYDAEPSWVTLIYGIAVWSGLAGSVLLVLRRKQAELLMLISLIALTSWIASVFLLPALRAVVSSNDLAVLAGVAIITWTIFWFARHSRQRRWLR